MPIIDQKRLRIVKLVAVIDILLAFALLSYVTFQFSTVGEGLIPGTLSRKQKITRLSIYATINYLVLLFQVSMGYMLLRSGFKIMKDPIRYLPRLKTWRAWSAVYMIILSVDMVIVSLLMGQHNFNKRKIISLCLLVTQMVFRIIGIILVKKIEFLLLHDMSGLLQNKESVVYGGHDHEMVLNSL